MKIHWFCPLIILGESVQYRLACPCASKGWLRRQSLQGRSREWGQVFVRECSSMDLVGDIITIISPTHTHNANQRCLKMAEGLFCRKCRKGGKASTDSYSARHSTVPEGDVLLKWFVMVCLHSEQEHLCLPWEGGRFALKMGALLSDDTHVWLKGQSLGSQQESR